jgi:signal transduction histidine kinase
MRRRRHRWDRVRPHELRRCRRKNRAARRSAQTRLDAVQARLDAAQENLRLAEKARHDFLTLISHELRTPLTALLGSVELLQAELEHGGPPTDGADDAEADGTSIAAGSATRARTLADIIARNGCKLGRFLDEVLALAALQVRDRQLDLTAVPVAELLEAALATPSDRAERNGLRLVNELATSTWYVLGDPGLLRSALDRLLDNAVVHNVPAGEVRIREVPAAAGDRITGGKRHVLGRQATFLPWQGTPVIWRELEIFNTGPAIPQVRLASLLEGFSTRDGVERHGSGAGMGLAIARAAVEAHGGRLSLTAVHGRGNAVRCLLPTVVDPEPLAPDVAGGGPATGGRESADEDGQRVGGTAGDEDVGEGCDGAPLEVEL